MDKQSDGLRDQGLLQPQAAGFAPIDESLKQQSGASPMGDEPVPDK